MGYNVLAIYDNENEQNYQKWYVMDRNVYLHEQIDYTPPFQFSIINPDENTLTIISSVMLVNFNTGVEVDILSEMVIGGFEVYRPVAVGYDSVVYPSTLPLGGSYQGEYFLKFNYGASTKTSDVFCMGDVTDKIKIEWWHNSDFCYPGGQFRYTAPFKMRTYVCSSVGKPTYEYSEKVVNRSGYKFPLQQIRYKLNKFVAFLPEFISDGMSLIRNHDNCEITENGRVYIVDEFMMENPSWLDRGDIAEVVFEFKTDTVVITNAKKKSLIEYVAVAGSCILVDFHCVAMVEKGSFNYQYFLYDDNINGGVNSLNPGNLVLINDLVNEKIELFDVTSNPQSYQQQPLTVGNVAFDTNDNKYFFAPIGETDNVINTIISNVTAIGSVGTVTGESFVNVVVEIWVKIQTGGTTIEEKRGVGYSSDLGTGINFDYDVGVVAVQIKISSANCPLFDVSDWYIVNPPINPQQGIDYMQIGFDFKVT
ncbi:MAG: hypothetical protein Unbinned5350contig1001_2 [Prokaryotic dsDNA virus sp.]|nr:MAG: hypothetical protein Unbinned5350contig1001_2 [Prokaryotic dsDNA virus sp.]|tara:strand:- start:35196 stop:36632 length:1437 start_codon:yes stop_codon:yes gene_type:complete